MPLHFVCPRCGLSMYVDERFAGESGPCAGCGEQVRVVDSPHDHRSGSARPFEGLTIRSVMGTLGLIVLLLTAALYIGMLVMIPVSRSLRLVSQRQLSAAKLRQISLAMQNYQNAYGSFPPAYVTDAAGQRLYSWRVLLLPYLGEGNLYGQYDLTKAWDAPENISLSQQLVAAYLVDETDFAPQVTAAHYGTNYYVFCGPRTTFPGKKGEVVNRMSDGLENTLLIFEAAEIPGSSWAAPIDFDTATTPPVFGSASGQIAPLQSDGIQAIFANGTVRIVPAGYLKTSLPQLIDPADGAIVKGF